MKYQIIKMTSDALFVLRAKKYFWNTWKYFNETDNRFGEISLATGYRDKNRVEELLLNYVQKSNSKKFEIVDTYLNIDGELRRQDVKSSNGYQPRLTNKFPPPPKPIPPPSRIKKEHK
jgi:hypothetical protein